MGGVAVTGDGIGVAVGIGGVAIGIGIDPFCWADPCWSSWNSCWGWWGSCWNDCWWGGWGWGWGSSCWSWCSWPWHCSWSGWGCWDSCWWPRWCWGWNWCWDPYWPSYAWGPAYVSTNWVVADAVAPAAPYRALTNAELGDTYLRAGDAQAAIAAYRMHLDQYPSDAVVIRSLGLALLTEGRADEAAESIDAAYRTDPTLASQPVNTGMFQSPDEFRINLELATAYANRARSAPAWLTVSVLLQGDGNAVQAEMMLDRAVAAGLAQEVSVPLRQVLRG